jgi:hypothetical protein
MKNLSIKAALSLCLTVCFSGIAQAQQSRPHRSNLPAILTISPDEGTGLTEAARTVEVWAGRATAIDFSRVNERIVQVFLADPSRFTYATDTPLDKGEATTLFLRQILPLRFPNLTTTRVTNLFVKTRTSDGSVRLYTFNIQPGESRARYNGVSVATLSPAQIGQQATLQVGSVRPATINDIERGLQVAISRGYTPASDPIVYKIREFLARARNSSNPSLIELAETLKIPLPVLTQLGAIGIEESRLQTPSQDSAPIINPREVRFIP